MNVTTCARHPNLSAKGICPSCNEILCRGCLASINGYLYCRRCIIAGRASSVWKKPAGPVNTSEFEEWKYGNLNSVRKICLLIGIIGALFYFILAYFTFQIITDPMAISPFLFEAGNESKHLTIINSYFICNFIFGLILVFLITNAALKWKRSSIALICGIGAITLPQAISSSMMFHQFIPLAFVTDFFFLVPVLRGLLSILPVFGISLLFSSIVTSSYTGLSVAQQDQIRLLYYFKGLSLILIIILFEVFMVEGKVLGSIVMYLLFAALGFSLLLESTWLFMYIGRRVSKERSDVKIETDIRKKITFKAAIRNYQENGNPFPLFLTIFLIILFITLPPFQKLDTPADIELIHAQGYLKDKQTSLEIHVINKGGHAINGLLEIIIINENGNYSIASRDGLEGFGSWKVEKTVTLGDSSNITLLCNGIEIDSMHITIFRPCMIPLEMVLLAGLMGLIHFSFRLSKKGRK